MPRVACLVAFLLLGACCPRGAERPATIGVRCHDGRGWSEVPVHADRLRVVPQPGQAPDRERLRAAVGGDTVAIAPGGVLLVGFARSDRAALAERARSLGALPGVADVQAVGSDGRTFVTRRLLLRAAPGVDGNAIAAQEGLTVLGAQPPPKSGAPATPAPDAFLRCAASDPVTAAAAAERLLASGRATAAVVRTEQLSDDRF